MEQRDNESYLSYVRRVTEALDNDKIDYKEWADCLLGYDNNYSSDNSRKASYFIKKMLPKFEGDANITDNDIIKGIQEERDELYKDKVKMRDQRRELNKALTSEARFDHLIETMIEEIRGMKPIKLEFKDYSDKERIKGKEAVAMISDIHFGLKTDSPLNYYDEDVAIDRLNQYKNKIIKHCIDNNVTKLNVELLGDCISGMIHGSVRVQQEEDVISQLMIVSEALANMIVELQQYIPEIVVYNVFGNHSRIVSAKSEAITSENMERLISFYLRARLDNNIKVIDGYTEDYLHYNIGKKTIVLTHGTHDKVDTVLNNMIRLLGFVPSEIHLAHRHHIETLDDCDTDIIANGSVCGTDTYATDLRKATKPSQVLRIYDEDVCTYKIMLD